MFFRTAMFALAALALAAAPAAAQQRVKVRSADAALVPPAEFYRIEDGVFALRPGMSVDLTNRKILLTFRTDWQWNSRARDRFYILLNGNRMTVSAGSRIDFKRDRATKEAVQDKAECFLDVVSFVAPKGAPPTATFRLNCI